MKITETIERECCHPQHDLRDYKGVNVDKNTIRNLKGKFCVYCGQVWILTKDEYDTCFYTKLTGTL